jgi:uncharacterized membrane protein YeiB
LVIFVYGLTFFIMGLAIFLQSRRHSRLRLARDLHWLAAFGILHGVHEWGQCLSRSRPPICPEFYRACSRSGSLLALSLYAFDVWSVYVGAALSMAEEIRDCVRVDLGCRFWLRFTHAPPSKAGTFSPMSGRGIC